MLSLRALQQTRSKVEPQDFDTTHKEFGVNNVFYLIGVIVVAVAVVSFIL